MSDSEPILAHDPLADVAEKLEHGEVATLAQDNAVGDADVAAREAAETPAAPDEDGTAFVLPGQLGIQDVGELHGLLRDMLDAGGEIRFDASAVDNVDGAGMQLLAVFFKEAVTHGIQVEWRGVSNTLAEAAGVLGLRELLNIQPSEAEAR